MNNSQYTELLAILQAKCISINKSYRYKIVEQASL